MKDKTKVQPCTETEVINSHLIKSASVLMDGFNDPVRYLEFLTKAIQWMDQYSYETRKEIIPGNAYNDKSVYFSTTLIEETLHPWIIGENVVIKIAKGLKNILDYGTYDYWHKEICLLLSAFAHNLRESFPEQIEVENIFKSLQTLYNAGSHLQDYEMEYLKSKYAGK